MTKEEMIVDISAGINADNRLLRALRAIIRAQLPNLSETQLSALQEAIYAID